MVNIAINGIGRIGKLALKILVSNKVNVKYINELNGNPSNLLHSFINSALKTAHGIIPGDICVSFIPVDIPIVKLVNFYSSSM